MLHLDAFFLKNFWLKSRECLPARSGKKKLLMIAPVAISTFMPLIALLSPRTWCTQGTIGRESRLLVAAFRG